MFEYLNVLVLPIHLRPNKSSGRSLLGTNDKKEYDKKVKIEIRWCDFMVISYFIMYLICHFCTNFVTTDRAAYSEAEVKQIVNILETNPIAKAIYQLDGVKMLMFNVAIPGMIMALYLYIRKRVKKGLVNVETLSYFCALATFSLIVNVFNDAAITLKLLLVY